MPSNTTTLSFHRFDFKAMGTRCDIRVFAPDAEIAARAVFEAIREINRFEQKYSRYREGNYLHRINRAAQAGGETEIDAEFTALLEFADICHQQSDGLFDITSGVLRRVWKPDRRTLPEPSVLAETLESVGWRHVRYGDGRIRFLKQAMELDLGGLVKEYAVDRAAHICREQGIQHGLVDLGGDIHVIGPDPEGKPWSISIRHPRTPDASVANIELMRGALATSGDYERCIDVNGRRYSHILSPATGWPVQGLASVSVLAGQCILAGSISTAAMLKERAGPEWLESLGVTHVWVDIDGRVGGTPSKAGGSISQVKPWQPGCAAVDCNAVDCTAVGRAAVGR